MSNIIKTILAASVLLAFGCGNNHDEFKLNTEESVQALLFSDEVVIPDEILDVVQKQSDTYVLVDIRPPSEFAEGHLQQAVNIPAQHVLEPQYEKLWKKSEVTYYFYGSDQLEANAPWMVLRQLGYENIRILQGGLGYFADFSDSSWLKLEDETARYDYASIFSKAKEEAEKATAPATAPISSPARPKEVVPQKRPKLPQPAVQQVEEEEEGC